MQCHLNLQANFDTAEAECHKLQILVATINEKLDSVFS